MRRGFITPGNDQLMDVGMIAPGILNFQLSAVIDQSGQPLFFSESDESFSGAAADAPEETGLDDPKLFVPPGMSFEDVENERRKREALRQGKKTWRPYNAKEDVRLPEKEENGTADILLPGYENLKNRLEFDNDDNNARRWRETNQGVQDTEEDKNSVARCMCGKVVDSRGDICQECEQGMDDDEMNLYNSWMPKLVPPVITGVTDGNTYNDEKDAIVTHPVAGVLIIIGGEEYTSGGTVKIPADGGSGGFIAIARMSGYEDSDPAEISINYTCATPVVAGFVNDTNTHYANFQTATITFNVNDALFIAAAEVVGEGLGTGSYEYEVPATEKGIAGLVGLYATRSGFNPSPVLNLYATYQCSTPNIDADQHVFVSSVSDEAKIGVSSGGTTGGTISVGAGTDVTADEGVLPSGDITVSSGMYEGEATYTEDFYATHTKTGFLDSLPSAKHTITWEWES